MADLADRQARQQRENAGPPPPGTPQPSLVGPTPYFPKVQCDRCRQIYTSSVVVVVPHTKPCPNCGCESFTSRFMAVQP